MKAVILAAGKGSRLGEITESLPKPLVEVGGQPVLQRHLEACAAAGCEAVFVNTHHCAAEIRKFGGDGSRFGLSISYSFEPDLLGTAGALHNFREDLERGPFAVLYGDNLLSIDLREMFAFHRDKGAFMTIALHWREDVSSSGMVSLDPNGRVMEFIEKPPAELQNSNLVNAGVYILEPGVFEFLPAGASDFGRDIIPALLADGRALFGYELEGDVVAIDTPELLERAVAASQARQTP